MDTGKVARVLVTAVGVLVLAGLCVFLFRSVHGADPRAGLERQIQLRIAEHQRLESILAKDLEAGTGPLDSYLARIRRDGVPQHAATHRQLAALAQLNAELLALAEAYEPVARRADYASRLRELRGYVIGWNERWNGIFETFMAGGNLAGSEPPFPARYGEGVEQ